MDKGSITAACLLDLTKGFDTISHEILIYKLHQYGFRGHSLAWIKSYLSNRSQFVKMDNQLSQVKNNIDIYLFIYLFTMFREGALLAIC